MTDPVRPRIPEIVRRPDLVDATSKGVFAALGTVGWILWLHMLSPLLAALAWWFGYRRLEIYVLSDARHTEQALRIYGAAIGAAGGLFILWSVYNWIRFRRRNRRGAPPPVGAEEIGRAFSIPEETVLDAQNGKIAVFDFDDQGRILRVATRASPPEGAPFSRPAEPDQSREALEPAGS